MCKLYLYRFSIHSLWNETLDVKYTERQEVRTHSDGSFCVLQGDFDKGV